MRSFLAITLISVLLVACNAVPAAAPPSTQPSTQPSAIAAAAGVPTVTVDPLANTALVASQPVNVIAHATDTVGVARLELRVGDLLVQTVTAPNPAGVPRLDAQLTWTPTTAGAAALVVIAYRADGTASAPATLAATVIDGAATAETPLPSEDASATAGETAAPDTAAPDTAAPETPAPPTQTQTQTQKPRRTARPQPTATATPTAAALPDLLITDMTLPAATKEGDPVTVVVTVANRGSAPAPTFRVSLLNFAPDGSYKLEEGHVFAALAAGQNDSYKASFQMTGAGAHTIKAVADRYEYVTETREDNNEYSVAIAVIP